MYYSLKRKIKFYGVAILLLWIVGKKRQLDCEELHSQKITDGQTYRRDIQTDRGRDGLVPLLINRVTDTASYRVLYFSAPKKPRSKTSNK